MFLYLLFGFSAGCLFTTIIYLIVILDNPKFKTSDFNFKKYPKICKNCKNFVPCVNSVDGLVGACTICTIETYHFKPNMTCGHFEYTEAINTQVSKNYLEKCFKK